MTLGAPEDYCAVVGAGALVGAAAPVVGAGGAAVGAALPPATARARSVMKVVSNNPRLKLLAIFSFSLNTGCD